MHTTTSRDGTTIAYDVVGSGPAVVIAVGAFNERSTGFDLANALAPYFTAVVYDRRGRGDSTDGPVYSPGLEVADLSAVINAAGGQASVFGYSSGAVLALRAVEAGLPIPRVVLYDPPTPVPGRDPGWWERLAADLDAELAADHRGAAVEHFQTTAVGMPQGVVEQLRGAPFRPALERIAHTLPYEARIMAADADLPSRVQAPVLVLAGGAGPQIMLDAAQATAELLPYGELRVLPGLGHDLDADVLAPLLTEFLE